MSIYSVMVALARGFFALAVCCVVALFTIGSSHIRIDTNLQDLNPDNTFDEGFKAASNELMQDVSHRFIVLVKGRDPQIIATAVEQLQQRFDEIPSLLVLSNEAGEKNYLSVLSPYQFNFLSDKQRVALSPSVDVDQLAMQAQHKLYQLGDGIRLVPFQQDPLGWFSNYLLNRFDVLSAANASDEGAESFVVAISPYPDSMVVQERLYNVIVDITSSVTDDFQVTVLRSGMFFFAVDSAKSAKKDIQLIAVGSIVGVVLLILWVFRSLLPLCLSLASITIGVSFGMFMSIWVFGSIHILTVVFGASLIGIVVDYSLHYFYHFLASDISAEKSDDQPASVSVMPLYRAMLLSVITSMIGYGALALSDLLLLKKIALFSCSGLLIAWLSVMVLGPLVIKRPIVARQVMLVSVLNIFYKLFGYYPKALMVVGLLLASLSGLYLYVFGGAVNDDPRLFFHVASNLVEQEQEISEQAQVYEPGRYFVVKGQSDEQVYASLEAFYDALGDNRDQVASVLDWLPSPADQQQNYDLQQALYSDGGVLDRFYQRLGMSAAQAEVTKTAYAEAHNRILRFPELVRELPSIPPLWIDYSGDIYSFILVRKNSNFQLLTTASDSVDNIQYINILDSAMDALERQRIAGAELLLVAYCLIALMLVLYYRRFSVVCLLLIPMSASIITLASLVLIGQAITVFHIMALFLVLGLGMDYIIFAKEMSQKKAVTQQAILLSAVTSLLSFGLLALSSMPVVQAFGGTILIGNSINFIAAISFFNQSTTEQPA